jgi:hypothetical protein
MQIPGATNCLVVITKHYALKEQVAKMLVFAARANLVLTGRGTLITAPSQGKQKMLLNA